MKNNMIIKNNFEFKNNTIKCLKKELKDAEELLKKINKKNWTIGSLEQIYFRQTLTNKAGLIMFLLYGITPELNNDWDNIVDTTRKQGLKTDKK